MEVKAEILVFDCLGVSRLEGSWVDQIPTTNESVLYVETTGNRNIYCAG